MAALDKDEVDFAKLERNVLGAMEADARYSRENDAKFRAVNQKVASYEEFRDIVLASHLKPLEKNDKMPEKFLQPWNSSKMSGSSSTSTSTKSTTPITVKPNKIPTTSLGLVNDWRRLKNDEDKLNYLLVIGGDRLKDIFKTEISGGLLGDLLRVLLAHSPEASSEVAAILDAMSSAKRFKLDLQFMSSQEKENCQKLFSKLTDNTSNRIGDSDNNSSSKGDVSEQTEGSGDKNSDEVAEGDNSTQSTKPTEEEIQRLMKLFEVTL